MGKILLGSVGSDVHSVANTLLEKSLLDSQFMVKNLGVAVPADEWEKEIQLSNYDLILIGTLNGDLLPLIQVVKRLLNFVDSNRILVGGKFNLGSLGPSNAPLLRSLGINVIENEEVSFDEIVSVCMNLVVRLEVDARLVK
jgi:methylmalonyl-CoA mutase cobalamin-binding subunit